MNKNINFRKTFVMLTILSIVLLSANLNAQNNTDNGADSFTQNYIQARASIQNEYLEDKRTDAFTDYIEKAIYMSNSISGDGLTNYASDIAINKIDNIFIQEKSVWASDDVYKINSIINYIVTTNNSIKSLSFFTVENFSFAFDC